MPVRPGGGNAKPRAKYNAPDTVNGRYRRGNRRWSSYDRPLGEKRKVKKVDPQFWTIRATIVEEWQCFGPPIVQRTYSCTCPDYSKQVRASVYGADYVPTPDQFTPRVYSIDSYSHYMSGWIRFQKGFSILSRISFVGVQAPNTWIYRIPTDRIEKYNRDWTGSDAGVQAGGYCKHIWATIFKRADPYVAPTDTPDFYSIEDLDPLLQGQ